MPEATMTVVEIPTDQIFADHLFNCRGFIRGQDVVDLAKSIKEDGLLQPIVVQPFEKEDDPAIKYRIIAGYRRYTACRVNKMESIPSIVREHMSDEQARILNLTENLKRQELNKLQEAEAIQPLLEKGMSEKELAKELGMSYGWVQIRTYIAKFDQHIKTEIAANLLTDQQIRQLNSIKDKENQYEFVKQVKQQKLSGQRKADVDAAKLSAPKNKTKIRSPKEILDVVETLVGLFGGGLTTVFGAWCAANTDDYSLHMKIKEEADRRGLLYEIPAHIIDEGVRLRMNKDQVLRVRV